MYRPATSHPTHQAQHLGRAALDTLLAAARAARKDDPDLAKVLTGRASGLLSAYEMSYLMPGPGQWLAQELQHIINATPGRSSDAVRSHLRSLFPTDITPSDQDPL